jgi:hypothetical protein
MQEHGYGGVSFSPERKNPQRILVFVFFIATQGRSVPNLSSIDRSLDAKITLRQPFCKEYVALTGRSIQEKPTVGCGLPHHCAPQQVNR